KRLIRKAGLPRWLHHYGPKKYEFWHHALAYLVKQECKLGYRRVTRLLRWLGIKCPCPSALCTSFNKIPLPLWQMLLAATSSSKINLAAIDASGLSRPLPSPYYYRRIDKPYPVEIPLKISLAVDTRTKRILALRLRSRIAHDIRDFKYLLRRLPYKPNKIVADKGYDANWVHKLCYSLSILAVIPARDYGSKKIQRYNTKYRKRGMKLFRKRTYNRREIIEAVISAFKRKFGASVSSVKFSAQRAELYCRAIAHNIIFCFYRLFERSLSFLNVFIFKCLLN
ncbi:MAG: transposase, partial [Nanoarchaeota archaeon]